jgi:hypothetical protein
MSRIKQPKEKPETSQAGGNGLKDMRTRGLIDLDLDSSRYGPDAPRS